MKEELKFLEQMNRIAQKGREGNGRITREEIKKELSLPLNETQWEIMGEFLFNRHVVLEGYTPKDDEGNLKELPVYNFTLEEKEFMRFYEEELSEIVKKTEAELEEVLEQVAVKSLPVDVGYGLLLPLIYEEAKGYADGREPLGDLVQEANLKIFTWLGELTPETGDKLAELKKEIRLATKAVIAEGQEANKEGKKIVDKLNQLVEAVEALKAQNALYTIEDLSEFLDISISEIEGLLKIAGE